MPGTLWFIKSIEHTLTASGYIIVITTDTPCHLWMRWTIVQPKEHMIPVIRRGVPFRADKYFCFDVYEDNEQEEAGDTLIHTFIKPDWPICETRYFYFHGEVAGTPSPSTTTIFTKHRVQPPSPFFLYPSAPGDETNLWQFPATGQNWDKVDDIIPDEDATYVYWKSAVPFRDLYNLPSPDFTGTINFIKIYFRVKKDVTPHSAYARPVLKSNATVTQGQLQPLVANWFTEWEQWNLNPADGQPWEWPDINTLQIGIWLRGTGIQQAYCTQLYVEIDYTP